jgi:hypothetical protein
MHIMRRVIGGMLLLVLAGIAAQVRAAEGDVPRITKEEAKALMGAPNVVFVDARTDASWSRSDKKIKGAARPDTWDLDSWAGDYTKDTTFIIY